MGTFLRRSLPIFAIVSLLASAAAAQNRGPDKALAGLPPEIAEIVDPDKDGRITDDEAKRAAGTLMEIGNAKEDSPKKEAVLKAVDQNKNKKVEAAEANAAIANLRGLTQQGERVKDLFNDLDKDRDGALTKREFEELEGRRGFGRGFNRAAIGRMFDDLDADRNGKILLEEALLNAGKLGPRFGRRGGDDAAPATPPADTLGDQVKRLLGPLDRDKDGKLNEQEVRSNKDLKTKFRQIDADLDGLLDLDEMTEAARQAQADKK
jgi:Ca2+-binding EF-hand superfamily protein